MTSFLSPHRAFTCCSLLTLGVILPLAALTVPLQAQTAPPPAAEPADASRIGLSATPMAPEFREMYDFDVRAPLLADATFPNQGAIHRAHVVMLAERGILTRTEASTILRGLRTTDKAARTDPKLRAYLPYEAALIRAIGPVAGKMHTARSRNDLANTENRMFYRDEINRLTGALIALRTALVDKAADNLETVMVVYTHRRQAQPITLGHYLMALAENMGKSIQRYEELYARMNLNPLGSAATAGSGFPLDRERTTALLGFDGLVVDTIEGVAGWDQIAELAGVNSLYTSSLGRLASELQIWSTDEFNMIRLDPGYTGASSIMPQKRNPDSLERTRQVAARSLGAFVAVTASMNAIEYQHSVARVVLEPREIEAIMAATHTMTGVIRTLQPNKAVMLRYAAENFGTMTELTDTIVRETGLDFREAHEIIARVVGEAMRQGKAANQIDAAMIEAAGTAAGRPIRLSAETVAAALDPMQNVLRRNGIGGPAPSSVRRMIDAARADIAAEQSRLDARRARVTDAADRRAKAVAALESAN